MFSYIIQNVPLGRPKSAWCVSGSEEIILSKVFAICGVICIQHRTEDILITIYSRLLNAIYLPKKKLNLHGEGLQA